MSANRVELKRTPPTVESLSFWESLRGQVLAAYLPLVLRDFVSGRVDAVVVDQADAVAIQNVARGAAGYKAEYIGWRVVTTADVNYSAAPTERMVLIQRVLDDLTRMGLGRGLPSRGEGGRFYACQFAGEAHGLEVTGTVYLYSAGYVTVSSQEKKAGEGVGGLSGHTHTFGSVTDAAEYVRLRYVEGRREDSDRVPRRQAKRAKK